MASSPAPWLPAAHARRLYAWSDTELQAALAVYAQACASWAAHWSLEPGPARADPVCGEVLSASNWIEGGTAGEARLWIKRADGHRSRIECAAFGRDTTAVTQEIVRASRADFQKRMFLAFGAVGDGAPKRTLPERLALPWCGALQFASGDDLVVVADATAFSGMSGKAARAAAQRVVPPESRVRPVEDAIGDITVSFDLELDGCELDAASVVGLACGDVVCLPHPLDAPARLRDGDGRECFQVDLRRQAGRRAVQLRAAGGQDANERRVA